MLGPLCNQTVNLKTDSNTLYYSIMKLKSSPSILNHNKGLRKYAFLNNSHNNCHRNYTIRPDISTNTHVQINWSILAPYGMHAMIWGFLCIMDAGRRVNKITAEVLTIYMGKLPVGGGTPHIKWGGDARRVAYGYKVWILVSLGCSGQNAIIFSGKCLV